MSDGPPERWFEAHEEYTWQPYRIRPLAVWAMRMNGAFEVKTLMGIAKGDAGDWLIRVDDGHQFPVTDDDFRRLYARREWKGVKYEDARKKFQYPEQNGSHNGKTVENGR